MAGTPRQSAAAAEEDGSNTVLAFQGVCKTFHVAKRAVTALEDVTFSARRGNVTGLVGPDAAGKTTLMRLATGLMRPDAGSVHVLGHDVAAEALTVQSLIGYMPQRFGLYEELSVQENLDLYADLQGVPRPDRPGRYAELMRMTALGPFRKRLAGKLSGGMKQKLGLACTLVRSPRLLLLDEPTVGVDPVSRRELWGIVYRLVRQEGVSVLLSTAYMEEAQRCDEVAMMHEGRLLGWGRPEEFSRRVEGRSYIVRAAGVPKRHLQALLLEAEGVTDALVRADHVRLVTVRPEPPDPAVLLPGVPDVRIEPASPRFEDGYVAILKEQQSSPPAEPEGAQAHPPDPTEPRQAPRPPGRPEQSVIRVQNLSRKFGDFSAVTDISFEVQRGEVFGLLGANGAGKSTTFRMLCGLLPPSGGRAEVAGADLRRAPAAARSRIGYMSQRFSLYGNLSVRQNLDFFSRAYGLAGRRRADRMALVVEQFHLAPMADQNAADLPLGFKQRLAMACSLMHEPDILFLDEPTSGVDPLARREFWSRINELADRGVTVMVTTHFMEEAEYCDRLAIMAAGALLAVGTPEDIRARARTADRPEPSLEEAFIHLIEGEEAEQAGGERS